MKIAGTIPSKTTKKIGAPGWEKTPLNPHGFWWVPRRRERAAGPEEFWKKTMGIPWEFRGNWRNHWKKMGDFAWKNPMSGFPNRFPSGFCWVSYMVSYDSPSHGNGNSLGIFFGTIGEYLRRIDDRIWWVISNQSSDYMSWFIVFEGD